MTNLIVQTVFGVIADFLAADPTPDEILMYRLPSELETRAAALLERKRADLITTEEEAELQDFIRADDFMTLYKAKTRQKISKK